MSNWFSPSFNYNTGVCTWTFPVSGLCYNRLSDYDSVFYQDLLSLKKPVCMDNDFSWPVPTYGQQKPAETVSSPEQPKKADKKDKPKETEKKDNDKKAEDKKAKEVEAQVSSIAGEIFKATNHLGTNDELLRSAVQKINSENVLEVMKTFAKSYKDKADGTLLEQIDSDTSGSFEDELVKHIADALYERAKKAGMEDDAISVKSIIESEYDSLWVSRGDIVDTLNEFATSIDNKEIQKATVKRAQASESATEDNESEQQELQQEFTYNPAQVYHGINFGTSGFGRIF